MLVLLLLALLLRLEPMSVGDAWMVVLWHFMKSFCSIDLRSFLSSAPGFGVELIDIIVDILMYFC